MYTQKIYLYFLPVKTVDYCINMNKTYNLLLLIFRPCIFLGGKVGIKKIIVKLLERQDKSQTKRCVPTKF